MRIRPREEAHLLARPGRKDGEAARCLEEESIPNWMSATVLVPDRSLVACSRARARDTRALASQLAYSASTLLTMLPRNASLVPGDPAESLMAAIPL